MATMKLIHLSVENATTPVSLAQTLRNAIRATQPTTSDLSALQVIANALLNTSITEPTRSAFLAIFRAKPAKTRQQLDVCRALLLPSEP